MTPFNLFQHGGEDFEPDTPLTSNVGAAELGLITMNRDFFVKCVMIFFHNVVLTG